MESLIVRAIRRAGVAMPSRPARIALDCALEPCVLLFPGGSPLAGVTSRAGGSPDLPEGFHAPDLHFLMQLRLDDVQRVALPGSNAARLPGTGLISVWIDAENFNRVEVHWFEDIDRLFHADAPAETGGVALDVATGSTMPRPELPAGQGLIAELHEIDPQRDWGSALPALVQAVASEQSTRPEAGRIGGYLPPPGPDLPNASGPRAEGLVLFQIYNYPGSVWDLDGGGLLIIEIPADDVRRGEFGACQIYRFG